MASVFYKIYTKYLCALNNRRVYKKQNEDYKFLVKNGVDTEFGFVTLIGKPIIKKHPNSIIKIDRGVTLDSDVNGNIAGISHPVILATLSEHAIIHIGKDSGISGSTICSALSVQLGEYVGIGVNSSIFDTDFHPLNPYERKFDDTKTINKRIFIDDYAWVGGHSIILKGTTIGKGAVVGAGSVVTKNVPELTVYAGNPAVFIKKVDINNETYNYLFNTSPK